MTFIQFYNITLKFWPLGIQYRHNVVNTCKLNLFDLILYVPSTIFQLNRVGSSWVEPVLSLDKCVLLKDHNAVTLVRLKPPASRVKHSTTEPLRSHVNLKIVKISLKEIENPQEDRPVEFQS